MNGAQYDILIVQLELSRSRNLMGERWQEMRIFHRIFTGPRIVGAPGIEKTLNFNLKILNLAGQFVQVSENLCMRASLLLRARLTLLLIWT